MLHDDWRALKAHIDGFAASAQMVISAHIGDHNTTSASGILDTHADALQAKIREFLEAHRHELPSECKSAIEAHVAKGVMKLRSGNWPPGGRASALAIPFTTLAAEVTYLLSDTQQAIRLRSERAFSHLRRTIEASPSVRAEWQAAFNKGETECEKLGATHLLLHGIFAFKAHASQARTDLVFAEAIDMDEVARTADGLVLTEWKKVDNPSAATTKAREAMDQSKSYQSSALAGVELRHYRYIVLVSKKRISAQTDIEESGIVYRHINIPVEPDVPSLSSKQPN